MTTLLQLIILCLSGRIIFGRPNGAPSRSCSAMVPGHVPHERRDLSLTPYNVTAEIDGKYVRVSITGTRSIGGFQIQARQTSDVLNKPAAATGSFKLMSNDLGIAKYQNCSGDKFPEFSSITHTSSDAKENLTFLWSPTNKNQNITVTFYATLAYNVEVFWVMQPSNGINILDLSDKDSTGKPGRASILSSTLSILMVTFMINLLIR